MTGFSITSGKGFHITFPNGVTVSVQFGAGSYSQHHDDEWHLIGHEGESRRWESYDAEVACWRTGGDMTFIHQWPGFGDSEDTVKGWLSPLEVLALLNWAGSYAEVS